MNGEEVYQELERQIVFGLLSPKERLVENDLCRKMGISRTLFREVLRRLEGMGLVTLSPNRGAMVQDFTSEDVENIYFIRLALEKAAAPLIINRLESGTLSELRDLNSSFEEACRQGNIHEMIMRDKAFHRRIMEVAENRFLSQFIEVCRLQTQRFRYFHFRLWENRERVQQSLEDHERIMSALEQRDLKKFQKAMKSHLEAWKKNYKSDFPLWRRGIMVARHRVPCGVL